MLSRIGWGDWPNNFVRPAQEFVWEELNYFLEGARMRPEVEKDTRRRSILILRSDLSLRKKRQTEWGNFSNNCMALFSDFYSLPQQRVVRSVLVKFAKVCESFSDSKLGTVPFPDLYALPLCSLQAKTGAN